LIAAVILACVAAGSGRMVVAVLLAALAGSLAGFLRYNVEPARIYLGDTGSLFLGLMLGALAMNNSYTSRNLVASLSPVVILGVPIFDMLLVMFIRWRRGIPIMRGSPDHFALRLRKWRLSTRQTVAVSYAATALLGGVGVAMMLLDARSAALLLAGTALGGLALGFTLKKIDMTL
jgi:UDP-GlcNAc:undecaprenyl-phosphate GlcNAc-1-phosphate transferase